MVCLARPRDVVELLRVSYDLIDRLHMSLHTLLVPDLSLATTCIPVPIVSSCLFPGVPGEAFS